MQLAWNNTSNNWLKETQSEPQTSTPSVGPYILKPFTSLHPPGKTVKAPTSFSFEKFPLPSRGCWVPPKFRLWHVFEEINVKRRRKERRKKERRRKVCLCKNHQHLSYGPRDVRLQVSRFHFLKQISEHLRCSITHIKPASFQVPQQTQFFFSQSLFQNM